MAVLPHMSLETYLFVGAPSQELQTIVILRGTLADSRMNPRQFLLH